MKNVSMAPMTLMMLLVVGCVGPSADERAVVRMEAPRINVHTYTVPERLRKTITAEGCSVEEPSGLDEGARRLLIVSGTGVVHWPSATVKVERDRVIINGTDIGSWGEGYRNVTVAKDGRVFPDSSIPWEHRFFKLW